MSQLHPYMQTMPSSYSGPLYQYLHHQQQPALYHNYIYSQEQTHTQHPQHQQHPQQHPQQKRY